MSKEKPLSERQKNILAFIRQYVLEHTRPPTIREIGGNVNISSTSVVNYNLGKLNERGFLERDAEVSRGLRLTNKARKFLGEAIGVVTDVVAVVKRIPLKGSIVAGSPIESFEGSYDDDDAIELSVSMLPEKTDDLYALRVSGDSMIDAMVNDGDTIIMRHQTTANTRNGDMVAAWVDGETTLKYYYNEGNRIRLQPANPTMEPIYFDHDIEVQGKVVMVVRDMIPKQAA